ncbi:MAG: IPTL-CTERM sorting domain-containing protein [Comamonadaceae bacterium]|nr:IPTL-CTERM sorting domain-containing protein [Comamonadaceae bacterium]
MVLSLLVGQTAVQAQSVLFLHTTEAPADAIYAFDNIRQEFIDAGATVTQQGGLNAAGSVTPATFTAVGGGRYDIVIMASAYVLIDPSNWTQINQAIQQRLANAFIMFNDGCCVSANVSAMAQSIAATGAFTPSLGTTALGTKLLTVLNANSSYSGSFSGLNPFAGGDVTYFNNVPEENALYLAPGSPQPAQDSTVNDVYGLLVPLSQSYAGAGACVFATVDVSPFADPTGGLYGSGIYTPENKGKVGPAFLNAIAAGGACGIPASITKTFAPTSIGPASASTLTITVQNLGQTPVSGLDVTDNLPSPLVVDGSASTTCVGGVLSATAGSTSVSLTGSTLPMGGCTITVPVRWPEAQAALCAAPGTSVTNTITPGTDFTTSQGQVNTPATATLSCLGDLPVIPVDPVAPVTAVPTLSQLALAALALLLGFATWGQRRVKFASGK